jgi:hypothetical protein
MPMTEERVKTRFKNLFLPTDLKIRPGDLKSSRVNAANLFQNTIGTNEPNNPGGSFREGPPDADERKKMFKGALLEFREGKIINPL